MQRGLALQDFAKQLSAAIPLKRDIVADTRAARMGLAEAERPALMVQIGNQDAYELRDVAHTQIAEWSGIPAKYYNRMRDEAPALLADNVNRWFDDGDKRMFRTTGGHLRAFLSNRYRRIENEEIARAALPILHEAAGLQIRALEITERRMYIYATDKNVRGEVRVGDVVEAGVKISNSEIGQGSASVEPVVFRLTCKNGATMKDTRLRATHVGRQVSESEDLNAIFADDTRRVDDSALLLKMRDVIRYSMSQAGLDQSVEKFKVLTERKIEGDPVKTVEVLASKIGATEKEGSDILRALIEGHDLSAYGIMNAVTYQAHGAKDFDRAVEFEDIGGKLALMPAKEWEPILAAA